MRALLQEDLADQQLTRRDLNEPSFESELIVAAELRVLGSLLCRSDMGETVVIFEKGVDSCDLGAGHAIDQ